MKTKNQKLKLVHVGFWAPSELAEALDAFRKNHGGLSRSDVCRLIIGGFFSSEEKPLSKETLLFRGVKWP